MSELLYRERPPPSLENNLEFIPFACDDGEESQSHEEQGTTARLFVSSITPTFCEAYTDQNETFSSKYNPVQIHQAVTKTEKAFLGFTQARKIVLDEKITTSSTISPDTHIQSFLEADIEPSSTTPHPSDDKTESEILTSLTYSYLKDYFLTPHSKSTDQRLARAFNPSFVPTSPHLPNLKPYKAFPLGDITFSFEALNISFPNAPFIPEPYFFSVSLYDSVLKSKITEEFHFEIIPAHLTDIMRSYKPTVISPTTTGNKCIFSFDRRRVGQVHLVIRIYTVLVPTTNKAYEDYKYTTQQLDEIHHGSRTQQSTSTPVRTLNFISGADAGKNDMSQLLSADSILKDHKERIQHFGQYKQPFGWNFFPLFTSQPTTSRPQLTRDILDSADVHKQPHLAKPFTTHLSGLRETTNFGHTEVDMLSAITHQSQDNDSIINMNMDVSIQLLDNSSLTDCYLPDKSVSTRSELYEAESIDPIPPPSTPTSSAKPTSTFKMSNTLHPRAHIRMQPISPKRTVSQETTEASLDSPPSSPDIQTTGSITSIGSSVMVPTLSTWTPEGGNKYNTLHVSSVAKRVSILPPPPIKPQGSRPAPAPPPVFTSQPSPPVSSPQRKIDYSTISSVASAQPGVHPHLIMTFPIARNPTPAFHPLNLLYLYPQMVRFQNLPSGLSNRNVYLEVRVKNTDDSAEEQGLPIIYNNECGSEFVSVLGCRMVYHMHPASFGDEIKINLPLSTSPKLHILFTFYHVTCKLIRKGQSTVRKFLAHAVLPLCEASDIHSFDIFALRITRELPPGYMEYIPLSFTDASRSRDAASDGKIKWLDDAKRSFSLSRRFVSTIYPQQPFVKALVRNSMLLSEPFRQFRNQLKLSAVQLPISLDLISQTFTSIAKSTFKSEDLLPFIPFLLHIVLRAVSRPEPLLARPAFAALLTLLNSAIGEFRPFWVENSESSDQPDDFATPTAKNILAPPTDIGRAVSPGLRPAEPPKPPPPTIKTVFHVPSVCEKKPTLNETIRDDNVTFDHLYLEKQEVMMPLFTFLKFYADNPHHSDGTVMDMSAGLLKMWTLAITESQARKLPPLYPFRFSWFLFILISNSVTIRFLKQQRTQSFLSSINPSYQKEPAFTDTFLSLYQAFADTAVTAIPTLLIASSPFLDASIVSFVASFTHFTAQLSELAQTEDERSSLLSILFSFIAGLIQNSSESPKNIWILIMTTLRFLVSSPGWMAYLLSIKPTDLESLSKPSTSPDIFISHSLVAALWECFCTKLGFSLQSSNNNQLYPRQSLKPQGTSSELTFSIIDERSMSNDGDEPFSSPTTSDRILSASSQQLTGNQGKRTLVRCDEDIAGSMQDLLPFTVITQLFATIDVTSFEDHPLFTDDTRQTIADSFFLFFSYTVDNIKHMEESVSMHRMSVLHCLMACAWILRNCSVTTFRRWLLEPGTNRNHIDDFFSFMSLWKTVLVESAIKREISLGYKRKLKVVPSQITLPKVTHSTAERAMTVTGPVMSQTLKPSQSALLTTVTSTTTTTNKMVEKAVHLVETTRILLLHEATTVLLYQDVFMAEFNNQIEISLIGESPNWQCAKFINHINHLMTEIRQTSNPFKQSTTPLMLVLNDVAQIILGQKTEISGVPLSALGTSPAVLTVLAHATRYEKDGKLMILDVPPFTNSSEPYFGSLWTAVTDVLETVSTQNAPLIFALIRLLAAHTKRFFFTENTPHCGSVCGSLLQYSHSQSAIVRREAINLIAALFALNMETGTILRMKIQLTQAIHQLTQLKHEEESHILNAFKQIPQLAATIYFTQHESLFVPPLTIAQKKRRVIRRFTKIALCYTIKLVLENLQDILATVCSENRLSNENVDDRADLLLRLSDSHLTHPIIRLIWLEKLVKHNMQAGNKEEAAITQVMRVMIIQDLFNKLHEMEKTSLPPLLASFVQPPRTLSGSRQTRQKEFLQSLSFYTNRIIDGWSPHLNMRTAEILTNEIIDEIEQSGGLISICSMKKEIKTALTLLDKANLQEMAIKLASVQLVLCQSTNDIEGIAETAKTITAAASTISQTFFETRLRHTFYRVGLFGTPFDVLNGAEYIYMEQSVVSLGEMMNRLRAQFKSMLTTDIEFIGDTRKLMDTFSPENYFKAVAKLKLGTKPVIILAKVELQSDFDEDCLMDDPALRNQLICKFSYDTTFAKEGKKMGELYDTHLARMWFETPATFPFATHRQPILEDKIRFDLFNPSEYCEKDLRVRIQKIHEAVTAEPFVLKSLQYLLSGALTPQINQGPMAIYRTFLVEHKNETSVEDGNRIRRVFVDFFNECRVCLLKHERSYPIKDFHNSLVEGYNGYVKEVETELGVLPRLPFLE
ncbi:putative Dedicator of cytokinesis protein 6 [Blattamonas nauphoetae]|uniref:Dedicator of cytokinesis protein 6 n=1 Tax=Blattamonas nauphoetae TaxID=2049346 RepID=A0ABQ9XKR8_9EUKA|nr:putative Dedicator of cytokinesis protein 6 [Blattamonas nauphoetae]